ncbi:MAG TPA: hypothetical protein PLH98_18575 [Ruminococcus flavefaciens]|nr:hypothetical protein [Ruminococcus flavefaciens]HQM02523.1 hypothetical protein [Ruminococcus flavefaciens]
MNKFWNWVRNEDTGASELIFNGPISESISAGSLSAAKSSAVCAVPRSSIR